MGGSQRLAAVAAVSHAKHYYNHTSSSDVVVQTETTNYNINIFLVSATLCGVLVAVCAACWRRSPSSDKPEEVIECHGVYTVSADARMRQENLEMPGPPPAYETVVEEPSNHKECHSLEEVVTHGSTLCQSTTRCDAGLPSYEAAVMLRDTKL